MIELIREFVLPFSEGQDTGKASLPIKTIIVGNNREYFSPLDKFIPDDRRNEFVESDIDEADMDLMWHGDDKIVILPKPIDGDFIHDISSLFGYKNCYLLIPVERGAGLCRDLMQDSSNFTTVNRIMEANEPVDVIPWGQTRQFLELKEMLDRPGVKFNTPETSSDAGLWIAEYLDTKIGSRELLARAQKRNPDIYIPDGFICPNVESALEVAEYFLNSRKGMVFKANLGGAGVGVYVFPPNRLQDINSLREIRAKIKGNKLFQDGPLVIEEYIRPNFKTHNTFPSVDCIVMPNGEVEVQAVDSMVIHHNSEEVTFYGCQLGKGLFTERQRQRLASMSIAVGEELSSLGYRGWYDVDYILSTNGKFYATEPNLRRTSICYMLDLAKLLFGEDYEKKMAMRSNDKLIAKNLEGVTYSQLKQILTDILYPIEGEKEE